MQQRIGDQDLARDLDLALTDSSVHGPINRRGMLEQSLGLAFGLSVLGGAVTADAQGAGGAAGRPAAAGVRRIVTGHNAQGKSCVISDEIVPGRLWATSAAEPLGASAPGEPGGVLPTAGRPDSSEMPVGSNRWMITNWEPSKDPKPTLENRLEFHRTKTLDYSFVLSGEITMLLDVQEVALKPGDVVIQRNTYHSWRVDGTAPGRVLMVMMRV